MPAFESEGFEPPAPVARATVRVPPGASQSGVPMLLDTGADVSVVPLSVVAGLGVTPTPTHVQLEGFDGPRVGAEAATLSIEFLRYRFNGLFVVADVDVGVIGRDILNLLVVQLDGPRQFWSA